MQRTLPIEMLRPPNLTLTQSFSVSDRLWRLLGPASVTRYRFQWVVFQRKFDTLAVSVMMWMYNSDHSDSDNFWDESETSYLLP